jgi:DNA-binding transcriptional MerR regulator
VPDVAAATLQIGEVAERVGLSLRTVRYYEEQGLVQPETRTDGGFRLYTERQIDRLLLIKQMKPLGFSLEEMGELLAARDTLGDPGASAEARREAAARTGAFAASAEERCAKLRRTLADGEVFAAELRAQAGAAGTGPA